jgi:hypothetical protein
MRFLHVAFGFDGPPVAIERIQQVLKGAGWARYAPNCWIVYTSEDVKSLTERLRAICGKDDSIFICQLVIETKWGYLGREIWDWINKMQKT